MGNILKQVPISSLLGAQINPCQNNDPVDDDTHPIDVRSFTTEAEAAARPTECHARQQVELQFFHSAIVQSYRSNGLARISSRNATSIPDCRQSTAPSLRGRTVGSACAAAYVCHASPYHFLRLPTVLCTPLSARVSPS